MRKIIKILIPLFLILTFGCENVDVITPDLNYTEKIVVRSELQAHELFKGVSFTRTLPLDEVYDIKNAELKNVTAYLKVNGIRIITLKYSNNGIYLPLDSVTINSGDIYELFAAVNGNSIYAKTKIPLKPTVISASLKDDRLFEVTVKPQIDEVYGVAWEIYNASSGFLIDQATDFQTIIQPKESDFKSGLLLTTQDLPEEYIQSSYNNYKYAAVFAFDKAYLNFFNTKNNNQPTENVFAQGGDQISWNVQGKNVIGLFIGLSNLNHIKVN